MRFVAQGVDISIPALRLFQREPGRASERVDAVKAYISDKAEFADVLQCFHQ